jgi:hypothetical protein
MYLYTYIMPICMYVYIYNIIYIYVYTVHYNLSFCVCIQVFFQFILVRQVWNLNWVATFRINLAIHYNKDKVDDDSDVLFHLAALLHSLTQFLSLTVNYGEHMSENCQDCQDASVCNDLGIENVVHLRRRVYLCQGFTIAAFSDFWRLSSGAFCMMLKLASVCLTNNRAVTHARPI